METKEDTMDRSTQDTPEVFKEIANLCKAKIFFADGQWQVKFAGISFAVYEDEDGRLVLDCT